MRITGFSGRHFPAVRGVVLGLALLGAGCSTANRVLGMGEEKDPNVACPQVGILRDGARITQFRAGRGRDLTDIESRAELADFTGGCDYDSSGVTVNLKAGLVAERGPAFRGNQANYVYFVAIIAPDGTVLQKREFATEVNFPGNQPRSGSLEELSQRIPLSSQTDGKSYQVLLGFQLSSEQLEYNRRALMH